MKIPAPAKINLFLHVGEKRADGYHALQSLVAFTEVGDTLDFVESDTLSLSIEGPFAAGLSAGEDNLVLRAARAIVGDKGAAIRLTKNLPVASGIGGGSADCAAALRGLSSLWGLELDAAALQKTGETLGSDVPVCVTCRPQWMEGRGEKLTALPPLPVMPIVLVNPGVGVPTGQVFAGLTSRSGVDLQPPPKFRSGDDLIDYLDETANDMEAPAKAIAPVIGQVLGAIEEQGAILSRMSGSGATCFGLFTSDVAADRAERALQEAHPEWWVVATRLATTS